MPTNGRLVGRYVPDGNRFVSHGTRPVAWSSNVTVMFVTLTLSPQSDKRTNLLPVSGATRSKATSLRNSCDKPFNLILRSVIVPVRPETVIFEGYGEARAASLMVIGAVLLKVVCANAETVKTAKTKIKLLKKDKTFIVPPRKINNQKNIWSNCVVVLRTSLNLII